MKSVFLVLFFLITFVVSAQTPRWIRSGSVKLAYRPSPLFYVFNKSTTNKAGSPGWLMVEVKYSVANKKKGGKTIWLDDITMETEVVIPGSYQSKGIVVLLKGETVFWSIPMDGKTHHALGCIPPQVIACFARKGNKIDLSKVIARVTFYTSKRKILKRLYSSSGRRVRDYFSKLGGAVSTGMLTVEDIVLPRTSTPWGVINYELYDLIKPNPQK